MRHTIPLNMSGLGIVFYSPWAVQNIEPGADFLAESYTNASEIAALANDGSLVGVCTGSPGTYSLTLYSGALKESELEAAEFKVRLRVEVRDETLCVRDLYDFISWHPECPRGQTISLPNGTYKLTAYTSLADGVVGENQCVFVHVEAAQASFRTFHTGVPLLC